MERNTTFELEPAMIGFYCCNMNGVFKKNSENFLGLNIIMSLKHTTSPWTTEKSSVFVIH